MKKGTKIIKKPIEVFNSFYYTEKADVIWKEFCFDNDIEYCEDTIDWNYICEIRDIEWEDTLDTLMNRFIHNDVILSGFLGLWNGKPQIANYHFGQIEKAIYKCISSGDGWSVSYDNWGIYIDVYHHDGVNTFTISPIKKYTTLSEDMIERFNPYKHKRLIQRFESLWD
jgi:hypothetical protein